MHRINNFFNEYRPANGRVSFPVFNNRFFCGIINFKKKSGKLYLEKTYLLTMIRYIFGVFVALHGIIHLFGYSRSFHYSEIKNITRPKAKPVSLIWFSACILFILAGVYFILDKSLWWKFTVIAVLLSQIAIFTSWKDAKYGTIVNILISLFLIWQLFLQN